MDQKYRGFVEVLGKYLYISYLEKLIDTTIGRGYQLNKPTALKSLAACPRQCQHRDYLSRFSDLNFSVVWAPFMASKILVSPFSHSTKTTLKVLFILIRALTNNCARKGGPHYYSFIFITCRCWIWGEKFETAFLRWKLRYRTKQLGIWLGEVEKNIWAHWN